MSSSNGQARRLSRNVIRRDEFVQAVSEMAEEVWDFHDRWGFGSGQFEGRAPSSIIGERGPILDEEVRELAEAVDGRNDDGTVLETADVLFVALGHVEAMGRAGLDGVRRVTEKNARKTEETHAIRPDTGKLLPLEGKPHKWK